MEPDFSKDKKMRVIEYGANTPEDLNIIGNIRHFFSRIFAHLRKK